MSEIKNKIEITDADLETGLEIKIDLEIPNTAKYIPLVIDTSRMIC